MVRFGVVGNNLEEVERGEDAHVLYAITHFTRGQEQKVVGHTAHRRREPGEDGAQVESASPRLNPRYSTWE